MPPPGERPAAHHLDGGRHGKRDGDDPSTPRGFCARYFSAESRLLLALVTLLLLVLPLVLPPLPPPPLAVLLVPVAMLAVLLALALTPAAGGRKDDVADPPASYL